MKIKAGDIIQNKAVYKPKSIDETNHTIEFVMSAQVEDRHGDVVDVATMNINNYMLNPVVIPSHLYEKKSVGQVIEIRNENIDGVLCLVGKVLFAVDSTEEAREYWSLYSKGHQRAVSIGFRVGRIEINNDTEVTTLLDCELMELSLVAVPANQLAVAKSMGVEVQAIVKSAIDKTLLNKEITDILIGLKALVEEEPKKEIEVKQTIDTENKTAILKVEDSNEKIKRVLAKAIRNLYNTK